MIKLKQLIPENTHIGYSLKKLPRNVDISLSGYFNDKKTIKDIVNWVKKNISRFEKGESVYKVSNKYKDLQPFVDKLEDEMGVYPTSASEIASFIETEWGEIENDLYN